MPDLIDVAVGVLVRDEPAGPQLLITRRPADTVLGGYWEMPGGKCEPAETPPACLVREFREELDITVAVGDSLPTVEHEYPHGHIRLHAFYCELIAGQPRNVAVAEHRWISADALDDYRFPPANAELIAAVRRTLGGAG